MNTSKAIAGISYNTEKFLKAKLDELLKAGILEHWFYIYHEPEPGESECGLKAHFHVHMKPNKVINTVELAHEFDQKIRGEKKPRKIVDLSYSKEEDWLLYSLHDEDYCNMKNEIKVYHYTPDDLKCNDDDTKRVKLFKAYHEGTWNKDIKLLTFLREGGSVSDLARSGFISPSKAFQYLSFSRLYHGNIK